MVLKIFIALGILFSLIGSLFVVEIPAGEMMRIVGGFGGGSPEEHAAITAAIRQSAWRARIFLALGALCQGVGLWLA